jgi:flavin reductase (DIM6/NTAB) family NADH-FMN oxidoreductase RutF
MNNLKKISLDEFNFNAFSIKDEWFLISSGDKDNYNTMTASWGGFGVLWHKNVASIYIRPQRYTYEFVEKNDLFTICFFDKSYKDALKFCGSNSGREIDKASSCHLTPQEFDGAVGFNEASAVFVCKKLYYDDLKPENFLCDDIMKNYANNDFHRLYIGEIISVFRK